MTEWKQIIMSPVPRRRKGISILIFIIGYNNFVFTISEFWGSNIFEPEKKEKKQRQMLTNGRKTKRKRGPKRSDCDSSSDPIFWVSKRFFSLFVVVDQI